MTFFKQAGQIGMMVLVGGMLSWAVINCGEDESITPGCSEGSKKDCTTSNGGPGEQVCTGGTWGTCSSTACTDGATLSCTQSTGQPGQQVCQGGMWSSCGPLPGACQPGTYQQCTTTNNQQGFQKCDAYGNWGICEVDQPPVCQHGATQSCSTACGVGTEICVNGQWQNCTAPPPQPETCDGIDNNCNGQIDEGCSTNCVEGQCTSCYTGPPGTQGVGQCKAGTQCCSNGMQGPCQGQVLPAPVESCADGVDNNCNGATDDGCSCNVGQQQSCGTHVGECVAGVQTCQLVGRTPTWGPCMNAIGPQAEANFGCDGKDNDCDGVVDNDMGPDEYEANDTCIQARPVEIKDTDFVATVVNSTLYPSGDVDIFRVTAREGDSISLPPCCPWPFCIPPDEQCNKLTVELIPPTYGNVQYQFTLLTGNCGAPNQTFVSKGTQTFQWDGACGPDDTRDFWIKVESVPGATPNYSCAAYKLKLRYTKTNDKCE